MRSARELVDEYLAAIDTGRRVAGKLELAAVARHRADLQRGLWKFDEAKATRAIDFIQSLELTEGEHAGQPFELRPWQAFVVWVLFGWLNPKTGYRRFRRAFVSVGRGNGKTPFGAAIGLYVTGFDDPPEAEAQGYATATKRDQARLAFRQAASFIQQSSQGLKHFCTALKDEIRFSHTNSVFKTISSDAKSSDGFNPQFILRDEYHAWNSFQQEFNDKLETALAKRRQPLMLTTTTAGDDGSELWLADRNFAQLVLYGDVTADDYFAFICEIDGEPGDPPEEIDDPLDPACWEKANPMMEYGIVKRDALITLAQEARLNGQKYDQLKRYHCNKLSTSSERLFRHEQWAKGKAPIPWDKIDAAECPAYCALDWGWKDDLAALGWVFDLGLAKNADGEWKRRWAIHADVWVPRSGVRDMGLSPWREWAEKGWITVTDGKTTDTGAIYRTFADHWNQWDVRGVAFDANNAREWGSLIEREYGLKPYPFPQNYTKYNEPTREFSVAMAEGRIVHGGNPLLAWAAANTIAKKDASDLIMPDKRRSREKIDPIVAVIMALSEALFAERKGASFYDDNEVEVG